MRRAWLLALALAACDSPDYVSGHLHCAHEGKACPDDFYCAADDRCWRNGESPSSDLGVGDLSSVPSDLAGADLASPEVDLAGVDLAGADFAVAPSPDLATIDLAGADLSRCGWPFAHTNFDPCSLPAATGDWVATNGTYDTDSESGANGPAPVQVIVPLGGPALKVIHVSFFSVPPGITMTIRGGSPLLIVADCPSGCNVSGVINVQNGINPAQCIPPGTASDGPSCGAGGGGGGFGQIGGTGGGCSAAAPTRPPAPRPAPAATRAWAARAATPATPPAAAAQPRPTAAAVAAAADRSAASACTSRPRRR